MGVVQRFAWLVGLGVAGCFAPQPAPGAPCSAEGTCPTGLTCVANVCAIPGAADAGADARDDAPRDAIVDAPADASVDAYAGPLPALVQEVWAFSTPNTTLTATFSTVPTAGHTMILVGGRPTNSLATVSGGAVTWQRLAGSTAYPNVETYVGVADGTKSVTITLPSCTGQMSMSVSEWTHVGATPIEAGLGAFGTAGPVSAGTLAVGAPRLLVFSAATFAPNVLGAPGAGWSSLMPVVDAVDLRSWYRTVLVPESAAPSVSLTGTQWDAVLVALPVN